MAIRYGYFNSIDGDRKYNAEDMTMYFKGLVSDGVYQTIGDMFSVTAGDGLTVSVGTGRALVNMHWVENTAVMNLDIGVASVSSDIYKLIVLRCDLTDSVRSVSVIVKNSSDGSVTLTNTEMITEICIARVRVRKNASTISQSDIRDYRGSTYCPWITGLVKQVDISQLNAQFYKYYEEQTVELDAYMKSQKESFDNWLSSLQSELRVDTKLKTYKSNFTTAKDDTSEIPLISNYEDGDNLTVYMNGLLLVESDEYTIENQKIVLASPVMHDNVVTQILTKSTIGGTSWATLEYPTNTSNFSINKCLTNIEIPAGTTSIGSYAFYNCANLTSITIPNTVEEIGEKAFCYCTNLENITLPNNEEFYMINLETFAMCKSLTSITIPSTIETIGDGAFRDCSKLSKIDFGESSILETIGTGAFLRCANLTNINIPNSVTRIEDQAFAGTGLKEVTIPDSVASIGVQMFLNDASLVGATVPHLTDSMFNVCSNLKTVTITKPTMKTGIPKYAFSSCKSLISITIPAGTSIGTCAFMACESLADVTIPDTITTIGSSAFSKCTAITELHVPDSVTSIGANAFQGIPKVVYSGTATGAPWGAGEIVSE